MDIDYDRELLAAELKGSLLAFMQFFYPILTGRDFIISHPVCRESHFITLSRSFTRAVRLELPSHRLIINVPPGSGKSTVCCMAIAWALAQYPDSRFLYISYSKSLASKHTETIKRILTLKAYNYLFNVQIRHDSKAKEYFQTVQGGSVAAFGSSGAIVGTDAGLPGLERFSGAVIVDDAHKIDEAHSDTIREGVIENYRETIQQRIRGINVPIIFIGQRVHEADLAQYLIDGKDGYTWEEVILPAIDEAGNALYPEAFPLELLQIKKERDPYVFYSQYQQEPISSGLSLFKEEWFIELDEEPEMLATFVTIDTAETAKAWNDASVFSFWGVYEIENMGVKTGELGLHWLDCMEIRVEPKDLPDTFMMFYGDCLRHPVNPKIVAIEKKSTGVSLISLLETFRGLGIREIERNKSSGSKTQRFLNIQHIVASKVVSFTRGATHRDMCVRHMTKITANGSHRHDDIADTMADAIDMAIVRKTVYSLNREERKSSTVLDALTTGLQNKLIASKTRNVRNS